MSENKVYSVSWHIAVAARSEKEALSKAKRKLRNPTGLLVEQVELPKQPNPVTHCRHGMLWSAYCDYC